MRWPGTFTLLRACYALAHWRPLHESAIPWVPWDRGGSIVPRAEGGTGRRCNTAATLAPARSEYRRRKPSAQGAYKDLFMNLLLWKESHHLLREPSSSTMRAKSRSAVTMRSCLK